MRPGAEKRGEKGSRGKSFVPKCQRKKLETQTIPAKMNFDGVYTDGPYGYGCSCRCRRESIDHLIGKGIDPGTTQLGASTIRTQGGGKQKGSIKPLKKETSTLVNVGHFGSQKRYNYGQRRTGLRKEKLEKRPCPRGFWGLSRGCVGRRGEKVFKRDPEKERT